MVLGGIVVLGIRYDLHGLMEGFPLDLDEEVDGVVLPAELASYFSPNWRRSVLTPPADLPSTFAADPSSRGRFAATR